MSAWIVKDADGDPLRIFPAESAAIEWCQREADRLAPLRIRNARLPLRVEEEPAA